MSLKELFKTDSITEAGAKKGDVIVIHTSLEYEPNYQVVKAKDIKSYFSEDSGWEEEDAQIAKSLLSGQTKAMGNMDMNAVIVVKF